jgi:peptide/nickel transport system permease protein
VFGRLALRYLLLMAAAVAINFALPRALPGDPLGLEADEGMAGASGLPAGVRAQLRAYYRLDEPLGAQFGAYLAGLARLDLGWSISRNAPVTRLLADRLPWTLGLVLTATLAAGLLGTAGGAWAAWRAGRLGRAALSAMALLAALPEFLVAMGLLLVFGVWLRWLPVQGGRTAFGGATSGAAGVLAEIGDVLAHLVLPGAALVLAHSAAFALVAYAALRATLGAAYIDLARAKGLSERAVALRHALPNALLPVLTLLSLRVGLVFGGAIVVERVFAVPGIGLLAFQAVRARDYPVMQAIFLLASAAVLVVNFATELLYARLNPLVRAPTPASAAAHE